MRSTILSIIRGRCGSFVLNQTPRRAEADLSSSLPLAAPAQGRRWMLPGRFRLTIVQGLARLRTNLVEIFTHPASPCRLHPRGRAWWIHVDPRGSMWILLDPRGSMWIHMDPCGSTWIHVQAILLKDVCNADLKQKVSDGKLWASTAN